MWLLNQRLSKIFNFRFSNIWLVLWLLLIPVQLGRHWWPDWSSVLGIRVDYLSPTLYLTDLVWGGWVLSQRLKIKDQKWSGLAWGVGLMVINIVVAGNKWAAVYKWARVFQLWITIKIIQKSKIKYQKYLVWVIPVWIVVESMLGWMQMINGGSLQGIWYYLGERRFSYLTVGIARWSILGQGLIRAYGTFSHPNSMAGFLLVSMMVWARLGRRIKNIFYWIVIWAGVAGIAVSGSRLVWGLTIGWLGWELAVKMKKGTRGVIGIILVVLGLGTVILAGINENYQIEDFVGGWDREGWNKRVSLNLSGVKIIKDNPLFGVGLNNFLVKLPEYQTSGQYWLQPVHNIILLITSESGLLGLVLIGWWFIKNSKNLKFKEVWFVILMIGMVDHYWVTLPQNMWLLAVGVGIMSGVKKTDS